MTITLEIKETAPGRIETNIRGKGIVTDLEDRMSKHVVKAIDAALNDFDKQNGATGSGTFHARNIPIGNG
jgi:hypothetical protein